VVALGRSLTQIRKSSGPKIEPCGAPMLMGLRDEQTWLTVTYCCLGVR